MSPDRKELNLLTDQFQILCLQAIKHTRNTQQKKRLLLASFDVARWIAHTTVNRVYQPQRYSCFVVTHPKPREIFSPNYVDRVAHHLLVDRIEPYIDPRLIHDSFANRKGKGVHKAIDRLESFLRKGRGSNPTAYYLQADIKSFFPSIHKPTLFEILEKHLLGIKEIPINEREILLQLGRTIIFQDVTQPTPVFTGNQQLLNAIPPEKSLFHQSKDRGLPIGSLTSQFFANLYMNELDQFIKHQLRVQYYIRYVDDFLLLCDNPKQLNAWLKEIIQFLETRLKLRLNPSKTIIQRSSHGIDFLGYIVKTEHKLVRRRCVKAFKRRLYFFNHLIDPERFPISDPPADGKLAKDFKKRRLQAPVRLTPGLLSQMLATINSYYGVFGRANSYRLRREIYEESFHILKKYMEPKDESFSTMKLRNFTMPFYRLQFGEFERRHPWEHKDLPRVNSMNDSQRTQRTL